MVKKSKQQIPAQLSPGLTRTASNLGVPGDLMENGLQDSGSAVEQPGLRTAVLLEENQDEHQRKKWLPEDNKAVMECYFKAEPNKHGYRQRMHKIWMEKFPQSTITEQRLADQRNVIIRRKFLTAVELEEIQRGITSTNPVDAMEEEQAPIMKH
jgi:hypothetical protein